MNKSFLNILLPNDEYKRGKILYFLAEAAVITTVISLCLVTIDRIFSNLNVASVIPLFLIPIFMIIYPFFRYVFAGMEYTEVADEKTFKTQVKIKIKQAIFSGILFSIVYNLFIGFPRTANEWYDVIGISILFTLFLFLINYISLKVSYKKNKELGD